MVAIDLSPRPAFPGSGKIVRIILGLMLLGAWVLRSQAAQQVLGPLGRIWLGIAFLCAGAATINTLMASLDRKSTRLNSSHIPLSRMPSSA